MSRVQLNVDELRDKVHGCWLGKNIGGTLGAPYEGLQEVQDVKGYVNPTGEPLPNDDLDLQLVWLWALQDKGPLGVNSAVLGEYWLNFVVPHWAEYAVCKANQRTGLVPPLCGMYNNAHMDSNGAWIRSEIWACIAPGCPDIAIKYAYEDACVDHGHGEGLYAALFTSALQSAAFVESDMHELIAIGLSKIPPDCRVAKSVLMAIDAYEKGLTWQQARQLLYDDSRDMCWFPAPGNIGFIIVAWLYGEGDFGRSLKIAVNCADDSDCTAATLGAILGIIKGKSGLPAEWIDPIGDKIVTICLDRTTYPPKPIPNTTTELTDAVMVIIPQVLAAYKPAVDIVSDATDLSDKASLKLKDRSRADKLCKRPAYSVAYDFTHTRVLLDYGKDPLIKSGEPFGLTLYFENALPDCRHLELSWMLPEGWRVLPTAKNFVCINAPDATRPIHHELRVQIVADEVKDYVNRGVLQIVAEGRPTVGLIPLVFVNGDSVCDVVVDGDKYEWAWKDDKRLG